MDTNILLRVAVRDDEKQAEAAEQILDDATRVVVTLTTICEFVWVLRRVYSFSKIEIANAIEAFLEAENLSTDVSAVEAGLLMMAAGGDFGDGVIAYEGRRLGGEIFVSFDKQAVKLAKAQGYAVRLL